MIQGDKLIKNTLGEGFLESLSKASELYKLGTNGVLDPEEIRIGLKVVPRIVMSLLISELVPMETGDHKSIPLPFGENAILNVTKGDRDSYSGNIVSGNKPAYDFMGRSIPGLGIILLSTFELYDMAEFEKETKHPVESQDLVQRLIEERLEQRSLISKVLDNMLSEREAIHKLIMAKLSETLGSQPAVMPAQAIVPPMPVAAAAPVDPIHVEPSDMVKKEKSKKSLPLKAFLERKKPKEFSVKMEKSETVNCPDCNQVIFGQTGYSGCVCMGSDQNGKIWLKKTEDGIKISFDKSWDVENIELLLEVLRRKNE
jgi:hypothetical protein